MSTGRFPLLGREHRAPTGLRAPWRPWREDATPSLPPGLQSRERITPRLEHGIPTAVAANLAAQGEYTVFLRDPCEHIVDMEAAGLPASPVRDPDVVLWTGTTWTAARFSTTIDTGSAQVDGLVVISTSEECQSMYTIVA